MKINFPALVGALLITFSSLFAAASPQDFKLYDSPDHKVHPSCDVFTNLSFSVRSDRGTALLTNHVDGLCDLYVPLNKRFYPVDLVGTSCGSKHYSGTLVDGRQIRIVDNRTRMCRDLVPLIVVTETDKNGVESKLYTVRD